MILDQVQNQLECLYGIGLPQRVSDFLINNQEIKNYVSAENLPKELFLVRRPEDSDQVEIALYLDDRLIENLANNNPFESLNDGNLSDFCILIEGISHFVYYLWKTSQQLPITQLELELQAEVDKFVMFFCYIRSDADKAFTLKILDLLFEDFSLLKDLSAEARGRYNTASTLAAKFCARLQKKFLSEKKMKDVICEIRNFYALNQEQKIRFIAG